MLESAVGRWLYTLFSGWLVSRGGVNAILCGDESEKDVRATANIVLKKPLPHGMILQLLIRYVVRVGI
jgi:hypothetical protein